MFGTQPEFRRRAGLALFAAVSVIVAAGCAEPTAATPEDAPAPAVVAVAPELRIELPLVPSDTSLALSGPGGLLYLGDTLTAARERFPRPGGSFPVDTLPEELTGQFEAEGWQTRRKSFAVILKEERVALALEIRDRLTPAEMTELWQASLEGLSLPEATIAAGEIRYLFWEGPRVRLMLMAAPDEAGLFTLARAIGHPVLMTSLRMDSDSARQDAAAAAEQLRTAAARAPKPVAEPQN